MTTLGASALADPPTASRVLSWSPERTGRAAGRSSWCPPRMAAS